MSQKLIGSVLMAALLVLAGCTGGMGPTDETTTASDGDAATMGTVKFYISDQANAINDFEHLNVTVDAVSFRKAGGEKTEPTAATTTADTTTAETETTADETATEETAQTTAETTVTETTEEAALQEETETETEETATMTTAETETEDDSNESDVGWETHDVDATTFDLTQLQGENAEKLSEFDLEAGTYTEVRLHISNVNGTLKDGENVNVKLPSNTLKIKSEFTLDAESETDFVYDITVHSAGNSGKYVIKPVVGESGANIPYTDVNADEDGEGDEEAENADGDLAVEFVGEVIAGENATVNVTQAGEPVADANVTMNGDVVGTTGEDGMLTFSVPTEGDVTVKGVSGEAEGEVELSLSAGANASNNGKATGTETAA